jgi:hypothetical protein
MPNNEMKVNFSGQEVILDRKRLEELAALLELNGGSDPAEQLASAFADSGLVEWTPAVETEPVA